MSVDEFHRAVSYSYAPSSGLGMAYYDVFAKLRNSVMNRGSGKISPIDGEALLRKLYGGEYEYKMFFTKRLECAESYKHEYTRKIWEQVSEYNEEYTLKGFLSIFDQIEKSKVHNSLVEIDIDSKKIFNLKSNDILGEKYINQKILNSYVPLKVAASPVAPEP